MSTSPETRATRSTPHRMMLPEPAVTQLRMWTEDGPPVSTLVHGWLIQAAGYAAEGRVDLIPPRAPRVRGGMPDPWPIDFAMSTRNYDDVRAALRGLCLPRDVVLACIPEYAAADGRLLRMHWPGRGGQTAAPLPRNAPTDLD